MDHSIKIRPKQKCYKLQKSGSLPLGNNTVTATKHYSNIANSITAATSSNSRCDNDTEGFYINRNSPEHSDISKISIKTPALPAKQRILFNVSHDTGACSITVFPNYNDKQTSVPYVLGQASLPVSAGKQGDSVAINQNAPSTSLASERTGVVAVEQFTSDPLSSEKEVPQLNTQNVPENKTCMNKSVVEQSNSSMLNIQNIVLPKSVSVVTDKISNTQSAANMKNVICNYPKFQIVSKNTIIAQNTNRSKIRKISIGEVHKIQCLEDKKTAKKLKKSKLEDMSSENKRRMEENNKMIRNQNISSNMSVHTSSSLSTELKKSNPASLSSNLSATKDSYVKTYVNKGSPQKIVTKSPVYNPKSYLFNGITNRSSQSSPLLKSVILPKIAADGNVSDYRETVPSHHSKNIDIGTLSISESVEIQKCNNCQHFKIPSNKTPCSPQLTTTAPMTGAASMVRNPNEQLGLRNEAPILSVSSIGSSISYASSLPVNSQILLTSPKEYSDSPYKCKESFAPVAQSTPVPSSSKPRKQYANDGKFPNPCSQPPANLYILSPTPYIQEAKPASHCYNLCTSKSQQSSVKCLNQDTFGKAQMSTDKCTSDPSMHINYPTGKYCNDTTPMVTLCYNPSSNASSLQQSEKCPSTAQNTVSPKQQLDLSNQYEEETACNSMTNQIATKHVSINSDGNHAVHAQTTNESLNISQANKSNVDVDQLAQAHALLSLSQAATNDCNINTGCEVHEARTGSQCQTNMHDDSSITVNLNSKNSMPVTLNDREFQIINKNNSSEIISSKLMSETHLATKCTDCPSNNSSSNNNDVLVQNAGDVESDNCSHTLKSSKTKNIDNDNRITASSTTCVVALPEELRTETDKSILLHSISPGRSSTLPDPFSNLDYILSPQRKIRNLSPAKMSPVKLHKRNPASKVIQQSKSKDLKSIDGTVATATVRDKDSSCNSQKLVSKISVPKTDKDLQVQHSSLPVESSIESATAEIRSPVISRRTRLFKNNKIKRKITCNAVSSNTILAPPPPEAVQLSLQKAGCALVESTTVNECHIKKANLPPVPDVSINSSNKIENNSKTLKPILSEHEEKSARPEKCEKTAKQDAFREGNCVFLSKDTDPNLIVHDGKTNNDNVSRTNETIATTAQERVLNTAVSDAQEASTESLACAAVSSDMMTATGSVTDPTAMSAVKPATVIASASISANASTDASTFAPASLSAATSTIDAAVNECNLESRLVTKTSHDATACAGDGAEKSLITVSVATAERAIIDLTSSNKVLEQAPGSCDAESNSNASTGAQASSFTNDGNNCSSTPKTAICSPEKINYSSGKDTGIPMILKSTREMRHSPEKICTLSEKSTCTPEKVSDGKEKYITENIINSNDITNNRAEARICPAELGIDLPSNNLNDQVIRKHAIPPTDKINVANSKMNNSRKFAVLHTKTKRCFAGNDSNMDEITVCKSLRPKKRKKLCSEQDINNSLTNLKKARPSYSNKAKRIRRSGIWKTVIAHAQVHARDKHYYTPEKLRKIDKKNRSSNGDSDGQNAGSQNGSNLEESGVSQMINSAEVTDENVGMNKAKQLSSADSFDELFNSDDSLEFEGFDSLDATTEPCGLSSTPVHDWNIEQPSLLASHETSIANEITNTCWRVANANENVTNTDEDALNANVNDVTDFVVNNDDLAHAILPACPNEQAGARILSIKTEKDHSLSIDSELVDGNSNHEIVNSEEMLTSTSLDNDRDYIEAVKSSIINSSFETTFRQVESVKTEPQADDDLLHNEEMTSELDNVAVTNNEHIFDDDLIEKVEFSTSYDEMCSTEYSESIDTPQVFSDFSVDIENVESCDKQNNITKEFEDTQVPVTFKKCRTRYLQYNRRIRQKAPIVKKMVSSTRSIHKKVLGISHKNRNKAYYVSATADTPFSSINSYLKELRRRKLITINKQTTKENDDFISSSSINRNDSENNNHDFSSTSRKRRQRRPDNTVNSSRLRKKNSDSSLKETRASNYRNCNSNVETSCCELSTSAPVSDIEGVHAKRGQDRRSVAGRGSKIRNFAKKRGRNPVSVINNKRFVSPTSINSGNKVTTTPGSSGSQVESSLTYEEGAVNRYINYDMNIRDKCLDTAFNASSHHNNDSKIINKYNNNYLDKGVNTSFDHDVNDNNLNSANDMNFYKLPRGCTVRCPDKKSNGCQLFECVTCGTSFSTLVSLLQHIFVQHSSVSLEQFDGNSTHADDLSLLTLCTSRQLGSGPDLEVGRSARHQELPAVETNSSEQLSSNVEHKATGGNNNDLDENLSYAETNNEVSQKCLTTPANNSINGSLNVPNCNRKTNNEFNSSIGSSGDAQHAPDDSITSTSGNVPSCLTGNHSVSDPNENTTHVGTTSAVSVGAVNCSEDITNENVTDAAAEENGTNVSNEIADNDVNETNDPGNDNVTDDSIPQHPYVVNYFSDEFVNEFGDSNDQGVCGQN